jgi:hypothetical protein
MVMAATTFNIKRDDLLPTFQRTLVDDDGVAVVLTGGSVKFIMADKFGTVKINAAAALTTPASGIVTYSWSGTDTDTADWFNAEWEFTDSTGRKRTFPATTFDRIHITGDLA